MDRTIPNLERTIDERPNCSYVQEFLLSKRQIGQTGKLVETLKKKLAIVSNDRDTRADTLAYV